MSLFTVDDEKCDLCQLCVAACPAGLVAVAAAATVPTYVDRGEGACFDCGHCVAACPTGAFAHENASAEDCLPIHDGLHVSSDQIRQLMQSRRSSRNFTDEPVARDTVVEMLEMARYAPSGCNAQPVEWLIVHDTRKVRQIAELAVGGLREMIARDPDGPLSAVLERLLCAWDEGADVVARGAPHLLLAHAPKSDPLAPSACIIAQTYLELAAATMGLGGCWAGYFNAAATGYSPMKKAIDLPKGHVCYGAMMVGYPKHKYHRIPLRNEPDVTWR